MKRTEKIKEIENLIEKNRCSRREFIDSLGIKVALGAISAAGLTTFFSCEKDSLDEENKKEGENKQSNVCSNSQINACDDSVDCTNTVAAHLGGAGA